MALRVLIADGQRLTREAVKEALAREPGMKVIAEASSGRQALAMISRASPDVAVIDISMPGAVSGLACVQRIRRNFPNVRVAVISEAADESSVRAAFEAGAHAFISKSVDPRDIAPALRQTVEGTVFHAPPQGLADAEWLEGLTQRELTVLKAVAAGLPNRTIAKSLWVSEHTIKFHLTNVFRKLSVSNRTEAANWAHQRGLVADLAPDELDVELGLLTGENGALAPAPVPLASTAV